MKEIPLQRLYTAFPGGLPGIAVLLLRSVFAGALMVQGFCYLREPGLTPLAIALGSISVIAGVLLLAGLVTPIAGAVVAVMGVGVGTSVLPSCARPLFSSGVTVIFAATILVAITVLGPGAYSVDARLFGRREIIIPRKPQP